MASHIEMQLDPCNDDIFDDDYGFLIHHVPFFKDVLPVVQVDLLAALWAKHADENLHEIHLAEAAVLFAILHDAARIANDSRELVTAWMKDGPRTVSTSEQSLNEEHLSDLFEEFWDDEDFLLVDMNEDGIPFQDSQAARLMNIPGEWIDEMYEIVGRAKPRPTILDDLAGLLTDDERAGYRFLC